MTIYFEDTILRKFNSWIPSIGSWDDLKYKKPIDCINYLSPVYINKNSNVFRFIEDFLWSIESLQIWAHKNIINPKSSINTNNVIKVLLLSYYLLNQVLSWTSKIQLDTIRPKKVQLFLPILRQLTVILTLRFLLS